MGQRRVMDKTDRTPEEGGRTFRRRKEEGQERQRRRIEVDEF